VSHINEQIASLAAEVKEIYEQCDAEGRQPSIAERRYCGELLERAEELKAQGFNAPPAGAIERASNAGAPLGRTSVGSDGKPVHPQHYDPGRRFVESSGYKAFTAPYRDRGRLPTGSSSGIVDITDGPPMIAMRKAAQSGELEYKTNLGEGLTGSAATVGGGGALVSVPQVVPGVVDQLFQRLTLEDLLSGGQASGPTLRYITESTAQGTATAVGEGSAKPQSTLGLTTADEPIHTIATWDVLTNQLMADAPTVSSYVTQRLSLFVQIETERELLRGGANSAEITGLLNGRGVPVYNSGTSAGGLLDQLYKAMNSMRGSQHIEPEWILCPWQTYQTLRLLKDTNQQYYGSGPWTGAYSASTFTNPGNQITGNVETLWGKPIVPTDALGQSSAGVGTVLIGTRSNAIVYSNGGLSAEASNRGYVNNQDMFTTNQSIIRVERRVGLVCLRAGGFVEARLAGTA
jgi:HK97 family phage major capsid protein